MSSDREERRRRLEAEIAQRLRRVRGALSDEEFDHLVASVVRTAERFVEIDSGPSSKVAYSEQVRRLFSAE